MKVFKFGGASVKDADGVVNLGRIVKRLLNPGDIIVVSAMGKTTDRLEEMANSAIQKQDISKQFLEIKSFHQQVLLEVLNPLNTECKEKINLEEIFDNLLADISLSTNKGTAEFLDSILAYGEILSTLIVSVYLNAIGAGTKWIDIRQYLRTDNNYGGARVDWTTTLSGLNQGLLSEKQVTITQGYIGSTLTGKTTTLGKEGSDFTAAIIARACHAEYVTFWKDVTGVFTADPKKEDQAVLFDELSYRQVVEMTYYGAKIIHPKTMKPLSESNIPLYVRSFNDLDSSGTKIVNETSAISDLPQVIFKEEQVLVSFKIINLEFIGEHNMGLIFYTFDRLNIQVNMIQSSAVSCSFVFDWNEEKVAQLNKSLEDKFEIYFNDNLTLGTFKNMPSDSILNYMEGVEVFLEQTTRDKKRILYKKSESSNKSVGKLL